MRKATLSVAVFAALLGGIVSAQSLEANWSGQLVREAKAANPQVLSFSLEGHTVKAFFFGCEGAGACKNVQLVSGAQAKGSALEVVNRWNLQNPTRAYIGEDGHVVIWTNLKLEGASPEALKNSLSSYVASLRGFSSYLASR